MQSTVIPKIIHLTCGSGTLPETYQKCLDQMRRLHPEWTFRIYHDEECRDIISNEMPVLLPVYDSYAFKIQRADMFRVVAVYLYGGFYMDMDIFCRKSLDSLCSFSLVLGEEKTISEKEARKLGHSNLQRIANYMFGSVPAHPFWLDLLKKMVSRSQMPVIFEEDILETTGPGLLTDLYHEIKDNYRDITLLQNRDRVCSNKWCGDVSCHFGDFAQHLHLGIWRWKRKTQAGAPVKAASGNIDTEEIIRQMNSLQPSGAYDKTDDVIVLETYEGGQGYCDGLSIIYQQVQATGRVMTDTMKVQNKKVLICGIPFLYEKKISPLNTNILFTTFESDKLPSFWVKSINTYYNYCVVPHEEIKLVFLHSGVNIPIIVIHQGYTRLQRQWDQLPRQNNFYVGFVGVPVIRKNLLKLYQACRQLKDGPIPGIKLAAHAPFFYDWMNDNMYDEIIKDSMVEFTIERYDHAQLSNWYNKLSCYVYPSSGEGWSCTPRESLYLGLPTIVSDIPVHRELIESGYCQRIPAAGKEPANFNGRFYGQWNMIHENDISKAILEVYENYSVYQTLAMQGGEWIEDKWSYEDVHIRLLNFIHSL